MSAARAHGLTLVELMIVLVVLAILATLAVPSFVELLRRQRVQAAAQSLVGDLQFARTEAQRRRATVTVETGADPAGYRLLAGTEPLKTVALPSGVAIDRVSVAFDALRGHTTATRIELGGDGMPRLRVELASTGRTNVCSPDGSFGGEDVCSK